MGRRISGDSAWWSGGIRHRDRRRRQKTHRWDREDSGHPADLAPWAARGGFDDRGLNLFHLRMRWQKFRSCAHQHGAATGKIFSAVAVAAKAIVTDPLESGGYDVQQKAADEFSGWQAHLAPALRLTGAVVLVLESDLLVVHGKQALVADGDTMGVASQIVNHVRGATEGWVGVDDPLSASGRLQVLLKGKRVEQLFQGAIKLEVRVLRMSLSP